MEIIFFFIIAIVWIFDKIKDIQFEDALKKATREEDYEMIRHLYTERNRKIAQQRVTQQQSEKDMLYWEAIETLDMAEHGLFLPDGGEIFSLLNSSHKNDYSNQNTDWDEQGYHDEQRDYGLESDDHWGPI